MAESITQRELRNASGEIMRRLDQGESFIVTRNGVPVGELTPLRRRRFVAAAAAVAIFKAASAIDVGCFRADLDAWAGQDPVPDQRPARGLAPSPDHEWSGYKCEEVG
jgi:prevent-host-death family protein